MLLDDRRVAQAAADAAALAGATDLYEDWFTNEGADVSNTARDSALATAASNGFNNDGVNSTVTVTVWPGRYQDGADRGRTVPKGYIEVIVERNKERAFSAIFGSSDLRVRARAVARGYCTSQGDGIICLNPTMHRSLNVHGNGTLNANSGAVVVNSSSSEAAYAGSQSNVTAGAYEITGGVSNYGHFRGGPVRTGLDPVIDPLATLPPPDRSALTVRSTSRMSITSDRTLQPGVYQGGIEISSNARVTFSSGIYYIEGGGLYIAGQSNVTGNEVMIYNAPASSNASSNGIRVEGQGSVTLSPPTTGTYAGLTLFQSRTGPQPVVSITGNGSFDMTGTLYAPSAKALIAGNGDVSLTSQLIVDNLDIGGNGNTNITYNGQTARTPSIRLVE
jgi:hypothetical protein